MKFKSKNPFLIKIRKNVNPITLSLLLSAISATTQLVPGFKTEGLNTASKPSEKKVPELEIREGNDYVEMGTYQEIEYDAIGVGLSSKAHITDEKLSDYRLSTCLPIYSVPVYDAERDFDKILDLLELYVKEVTPKPKKKEVCVGVTYHSNFIRVGNSRIDYDDKKAVRKVVGKKKKETKYSLNRIIIS